MAAESQFRCDVSGPEALAALRDAALPSRLRGSIPGKSFHRDIYLDTNEGTLVEFDVRSDQAMNAFHHPYVYASLEKMHLDSRSVPAAA